MLLPKLLKMSHASWLELVIFFSGWAAIWLPIAFLVSRSLNWQPKEALSDRQKLILLGSLYILIPVAIGWEIDRELSSFTSLGLTPLSRIFPDLLWGLCLSIVSLVFIFGLESAGNLISWHGQNIKQLLPISIPVLSLSLLISLAEESVFRGYVLSTLLLDNSLLVAAITSSLIFAISHLIWERKQTLWQIPGLWLMGIVLVAARIVGDGTIYLPLGLHAGWIWGLTCIDSAELVTYNYQNHWITGINRQPLAGIGGIFCLVLTGLAIWIISNSNLWR